MSVSTETPGAPAATTTLAGWDRLRVHLGRPIIVRLFSLIVVLGLWQLIGTGKPYSVTTPSAIFSAADHVLVSQVFPAFGSTLKAFGAGFGISAVLGVPVGLLMGQSRLVELALRPYVSALYATPRVALIPVVMLWAGLAFKLQLTVAVLFGIFPIILNTYIGVKEVPRNFTDAGIAFNASRWQIMRTVIIPGSLHYIFAGLRIGIGYAMIGTVVAEIEASVVGVGNLMSLFGQELKVSDMWVPLILLGLFSVLLSVILKWLERWTTMPWTRGKLSSDDEGSQAATVLGAQ